MERPQKQSKKRYYADWREEAAGLPAGLPVPATIANAVASAKAPGGVSRDAESGRRAERCYSDFFLPYQITTTL
ncbi:hypothetical protein DU490_11060 [Halomonas sp. DQ26W]|nr:hypothetical protein DU490_11060 [Halomonas sp. DQ26W]